MTHISQQLADVSQRRPTLSISSLFDTTPVVRPVAPVQVSTQELHGALYLHLDIGPQD